MADKTKSDEPAAPKAEKKPELSPGQRARLVMEQRMARTPSLVANVPEGKIARIINPQGAPNQAAALRDRLRRLGFERATEKQIADSGMYTTHHGGEVEIWLADAEVGEVFAEESIAKAIRLRALAKGKPQPSLHQARVEARKQLLMDRRLGEVQREINEQSQSPDFLR